MVGESRHPCRTPINCCLEPVSYAAVEEDGTSGLVIEVFDGLDKVCADVALLHGCPQSCMPNPVEGLLEVTSVTETASEILGKHRQKKNPGSLQTFLICATKEEN